MEARLNKARDNFFKGKQLIEKSPIFTHLFKKITLREIENEKQLQKGYAYIYEDGVIFAKTKRMLKPEQWVYVLAHQALHLAFGHFKKHIHQELWNKACDCLIYRFLKDLKVGQPPDNYELNLENLPLSSEEELYRFFVEQGVPAHLHQTGFGETGGDFFFEKVLNKTDWALLFSIGLREGVTAAVNTASGQSAKHDFTLSHEAKEWFMNSFPLLGALAADFKIIENADVCKSLDIRVAAICVSLKEIYINPLAGMSKDETRFVMAHEILHAGLCHEQRRMGRDPYLWNVACDYVINSWLIEMNVGSMPSFGGLHDETLKDLSAESVYERITTDLRRMRKLITLRGQGVGDMIENKDPSFWGRLDGQDLESFYRRALIQGLDYHQAQGRGLLPGSLVEEINALAQPPLPWDVKLAEWFDHRFSPIEKRRSFARLSRRQSTTPDIPKPAYYMHEEAHKNRTFGIVLDTSGSMDRVLLAKALGAIATYALSRDVLRVRLIYCDAKTYDEGYVAPENLLQDVKVRGRGGTVLQPALDLLQRAEDFPQTAPILIITDGDCDKLKISRDHAFLMPSNQNLPFVPWGEVFRMQ